VLPGSAGFLPAIFNAAEYSSVAASKQGKESLAWRISIAFRTIAFRWHFRIDWHVMQVFGEFQ
jgi:hypothetical protein